jgi:circadian clock protein KaiC
MDESDLVRTGIVGLDDILRGGLPQNNVTLVEGASGTGKTVMGLEFIYRGITEYHEPGLVVTFEVAPWKLIRDALGFGWDLEALQERNQLRILFTSPQVFIQELRSPDSLLLEVADQMEAQRIFIDGISILRTLSIDPNRPDEGYGNGLGSYRNLLQLLVEGLQRENLTAILAHEASAGSQQAGDVDIIESLCDTVIVLRREQQRRGIYRSLEITKSRGQGFDTGRHTLRITGGQGLEVFRRVQSPPRDLTDEHHPTSRTRQSVTGSAPIDDLFGGGVFEGSVTMVVGVSGAGKTVLGTQLLVEGARNQRPGLMISLDEHPEQVMRNAETLGINLREYLDSGMIQFFYDSPRELELDVHFARITQLIEAHQIQRLIIDGVTSYTAALDDEQLYREFFHTLVSYCKKRLMTTFLSYENPELFGVNQFMPNFPVSSIVDNIVLLNFVELSNTLHRAMTVAKSRGSANQFVTREFTIGEGGIALLPVDPAQALPVLPFASYYGVLSRAPTRLSADRQAGGGGEGNTVKAVASTAQLPETGERHS